MLETTPILHSSVVDAPPIRADDGLFRRIDQLLPHRLSGDATMAPLKGSEEDAETQAHSDSCDLSQRKVKTHHSRDETLQHAVALGSVDDVHQPAVDFGFQRVHGRIAMESISL